VSVIVFPPATLKLAPSSGILGTKVQAQGFGFPFRGGAEVLMTFDDMLIGFAFTQNGTFTFTFDVPHAEPGLHKVKASLFFPGTNATADFLVLPLPDNLRVVVTTAAIYFPGDTVVVYALTSRAGTPVSPSSLQIQLIKPDNSIVTLNATSLGQGVFRATFTIPKTGPLGTYAIVATAHASGSVNSSALTSFEVKPTWLSSNSSQIIGGATLAGIVTLMSAAWWKGYFRKKDDN
jgi:hypothetical protein